MRACYVKSYGVDRIWIDNLSFDDDEILGPVRKATNNGYVLDLNAGNLRLLRQAGFEFDPDLKRIRRNMRPSRSPDSFTIKTPKITPKPFQEEGTRFIESRDGRVLLADEQGLGKTLEYSMWFMSRPDVFPVVIVCPGHLKYNWRNELRKAYGKCGIVILNGLSPQPIPKKARIVIVNYDILPKWVHQIVDLKPGALACDEAHYLKTRGTKRGKAIATLIECLPKARVCMMTGTPVVNTAADVWSIVNYIDPHILGSWTSFIQEFCVNRKRYLFVKKMVKGKPRKVRIKFHVQEGAVNTKKLHEILSATCMLRRRKEDVWDQMPPKIRQIVPVDVQDTASVRTAHAESTERMKLAKNEQEMVHAYSPLRRALGLAKLPEVIAFIESYLVNSDKPLVVMGWHIDVIDGLHKKFPQSVVVRGGYSAEAKNRACGLFQAGKVRLFFGNIKSAGTGLTLTRAHTMLFCELPLTSGDLDQSEDRIHRLTQMAKKVHYYYIVVKDSLEERLIELLDAKRNISSSIIDGIGNGDTGTGILMQLFREALDTDPMG